MIELQNKFFKLVDNAVALNIESQLEVEDKKSYMAPSHWLQEYGTVDINIGRRVGKTTYIQLRMTPCDLVIVPVHLNVGDYAIKLGLEKVPNNVFAAAQMWDRFNMSGYWRGRRDVPEYFNKVYVDEPSLVFATKNSRYQFFDWLGSQCNQVIMLGTPVRL